MKDELYNIAFPDPSKRLTLMATVVGCARCGGVHAELKFIRFGRLSGENTHWAFCPTTGEPILLKTVSVEHDK